MALGRFRILEPTREEGLLSLEICFNLAEKHGCFVHVFCDEMDDAHSTFLESVAHLAIRSGLRERVTAAHANAAAYYGEAYYQKVQGLLARSGMNIVCCPLINSAMQGRFDGYPKGRGITRIKELWSAGVNVSIAHDDIQTPFLSAGYREYAASSSYRCSFSTYDGARGSGGACAYDYDTCSEHPAAQGIWARDWPSSQLYPAAWR